MNKYNDKKKTNAKQKNTNKEEKWMKNSYIYGVLSVGQELKKKSKREKQNKWKGIVKKPKT